MDSKRFDPSKFTATKAKPLPVMLLLDVSGSMNEVVNDSFERTGETVVADGQTWEIVKGGVSRIQILNQAVTEMLASLAREEQLDHEFLVSVITFGETVRVHSQPSKASTVAWAPLEAGGETPLGEAITTAKRIIENKETTPSRAYRPVVVLVSDGRPTDAWQAALENFVGEGRSMKCDRMAVAIGSGADEDVLGKFIAGTPNPVFHASDAGQILETFRRVTMSVTVRSKSRDPNLLVPIVAAPVEQSAPGTAGGQASKAAASQEDDGYW